MLSNDYDAIKLFTIFGGFETGYCDSGVLCGNISKPVSAYFEIASDWWDINEYKVGIQFNTENGGVSIAQGAGESCVAFAYGGDSLEITTGYYKIGFTHRTGVDFGSFTAGHYEQLYIRPIPIAGALLALEAAVSGVKIAAMPLALA